MKEKNPQTMKLLCYLCIVFCSLLIIVPPVLRVIVPKEEDIPVDKEKYKSLSCNTRDNGETLVVTYYGDDLVIGQIKYTFVMDSESFIVKELKDDLEKIEDINKRIIENKDEPDKMQYLLVPKNDSSKILSNDELLLLSPNVKQEPTMQKTYYENLGLTCNLIEN